MDGCNEWRFPCTIRNLRKVLDDPSTDPIVSWGESGKSFIIWDESEFHRVVLPTFTIRNNMKPLLHKLKKMGFKKIDSEHFEYRHDSFVRGQPDPPRPMRDPTEPLFLHVMAFLQSIQRKKLEEAMIAFEEKREYQRNMVNEGSHIILLSIKIWLSKLPNHILSLYK